MLPSMPTGNRAPARQRPLAIDIGGTAIKASVLDASGSMIADRVVVATPYPCSPGVLVTTLANIAKRLPAFHRASVGFPGVVRHGKVLSAPEFVKVGGLGTMLDPRLEVAWSNYNLAGALLIALARPT